MGRTTGDHGERSGGFSLKCRSTSFVVDRQAPGIPRQRARPGAGLRGRTERPIEIPDLFLSAGVALPLSKRGASASMPADLRQANGSRRGGAPRGARCSRSSGWWNQPRNPRFGRLNGPFLRWWFCQREASDGIDRGTVRAARSISPSSNSPQRPRDESGLNHIPYKAFAGSLPRAGITDLVGGRIQGEVVRSMTPFSGDALSAGRRAGLKVRAGGLTIPSMPARRARDLNGVRQSFVNRGS